MYDIMIDVKKRKQTLEYHGMSNSVEYRTWQSMRNRCNNPKYIQTQYYGGRGIKVCEEWNNSFLSFYNCVGSRPSKLHSLDRIDNDGSYEPGNVRWATKEEQVLNRRTPKNNTSGFKGVYYYDGHPEQNIKNRWVAFITRGKYKKYVGYFNTPEEANQARLKELSL